MANRSIQQKLLKMKRRKRFARFTGATSKYAERVGPTPFEKFEEGGETKTRTLATKMVLVGEVSLSKQVVNTGRGPDQSRVQEYYARLSVESYLEVIPDAIPLTEPVKEMAKRYFKILDETPKTQRITVFQDRMGRIDLFYIGELCFFVELDFIDGMIRRSRDYNKKSTAFDRYNNNRIAWVAVFTP